MSLLQWLHLFQVFLFFQLTVTRSSITVHNVLSNVKSCNTLQITKGLRDLPFTQPKHYCWNMFWQNKNKPQCQKVGDFSWSAVTRSDSVGDLICKPPNETGETTQDAGQVVSSCCLNSVQVQWLLSNWVRVRSSSRRHSSVPRGHAVCQFGPQGGEIKDPSATDKAVGGRKVYEWVIICSYFF